MSQAAASAFLDAVEADDELYAAVVALRSDAAPPRSAGAAPPQDEGEPTILGDSLAYLGLARGLTFNAGEIREAWLERVERARAAGELRESSLDKVSGGAVALAGGKAVTVYRQLPTVSIVFGPLGPTTP